MSETTLETKKKGGAKKRYDELASLRAPFLERARLCSTLTIPAILPPEGYNGTSLLPQPYQSIGARGTKNLSSRIIKTLFPPNIPNFRYELSPVSEAFIDANIKAGSYGPDAKTELKKQLNDIEKLVANRFEQSNRRATLTEATNHLIIAGNVLCHFKDDGNMRLITLNNYVVKRDNYGLMVDLVFVEKVARITLPKDVVDYCLANLDTEDGDESGESAVHKAEELLKKPDVEIFTRIVLTDKRAKYYKLYQEINGVVVPNSEETFRVDACPFVALRFYPTAQGEDYGRSYVEECLGDLSTFESNSMAITLASSSAAKVIWLVEPGGTVNVVDLNKAKNGAFIKGSVKDINALTLQSKNSDFNVTLSMNQQIQSRLEYAFLLNSALQRSGDRVTATEIQVMAQELEEALGGIYSTLSIELVSRLVRLDLDYLERQGLLPDSKTMKEIAKPIPITGIAAFARDAEAQRLMTYAQAITSAGAGSAINPQEIADRLAIAMGIDKTNLIKSAEQLRQDQINATLQQNAGELIKQGGAMAQQANDINAQQQQQDQVPPDQGGAPQ